MNLAIDLDGTLAEWGADHSRCGVWLPGAREAVASLIDEGHGVTVHTCRATWDEGGGVEEVARFLWEGGFVPVAVPDGSVLTPATGPPDEFQEEPVRVVGIWVGSGKPIAHVYVDDRAVRFEDSWPATLAQIRAAA